MTKEQWNLVVASCPWRVGDFVAIPLNVCPARGECMDFFLNGHACISTLENGVSRMTVDAILYKFNGIVYELSGSPMAYRESIPTPSDDAVKKLARAMLIRFGATESYSEFYTLSAKFKAFMRDYSEKMGWISNAYWVAVGLWEEVAAKAYRDSDYCEKAVEYLKHGKTLELKGLLESTNFESANNLLHSNAFELLDSCHLHFTELPY
jgi:hypothetical protein